MEVRLTGSGKKLFDHSRQIISVSNDRAYALMDGGYAIPDKKFMARFTADDAETVKAKKKVEAEAKAKKKAEAEAKKEAAAKKKADAKAKKEAEVEKAKKKAE